MITLTTIDKTLMQFNPNLIAVMNPIERFATVAGIIPATALWMGGDKPFYVRETVDEINALITARATMLPEVSRYRW